MSGGYSTADGALGEVSVSERNLLGRGLFAKASVTYGQYARGYSLSFVEPYLLDYRVALGLDLFQRQQLANSYISYGTKTLGFSPRLGFALREDLALQLRYSIYQQEIYAAGPAARTVTTNPTIRRWHSIRRRPLRAIRLASALGYDAGERRTASGIGLWLLQRRRSLAAGPQGTAGGRR